MLEIKKLANKISVDDSDFSICLDTIEHEYSISEIDTVIRLHHLKFDGNKNPMTKALADTLYTYIIDYCISSRNRQEPLTPKQSAILTKEARSLLDIPKYLMTRQIKREKPEKRCFTSSWNQS